LRLIIVIKMEYKEDKHYIGRVLKGEANAYAFLVNKYKSMAYSLALKLVKNREDAEEIAQDAFIKAYQSLAQFRGSARFSTWLYRIVYNSAISHMRRNSAELVSIEDSGFTEKESSEVNDAYYRLKEQERKKFLDLVLEKLDPDENFLVTLYYYDEKDLDEIGRITGLTKNNAKVKIFRARQKMMIMLKKYLDEELTMIL
jgi:RNA polymerase sigma factor (sigma-70 family)